MFNPFSRAPRGGAAWFNAGPVSSYPNITAATSGPLGQQRACNDTFRPGCRVFHVPRDDAAHARPVEIDDWEEGGDKKEQVMVFRYEGGFVAVNHECPHNSFPLSSGTPFDIEDFGVRLSAGITCPKHDWSFDLHTGRSDRGTYRLQIWEAQVRKGDGDEEEVWVRRKQRIG